MQDRWVPGETHFARVKYGVDCLLFRTMSSSPIQVLFSILVDANLCGEGYHGGKPPRQIWAENPAISDYEKSGLARPLAAAGVGSAAILPSRAPVVPIIRNCAMNHAIRRAEPVPRIRAVHGVIPSTIRERDIVAGVLRCAALTHGHDT